MKSNIRLLDEISLGSRTPVLNKNEGYLQHAMIHANEKFEIG